MNRRLRLVLSILIPFLVPVVVGLAVHRQGFNLLDDGLWLLGTRILVTGGTLYGDLFSIYGPARYFLLAPFFLLLGQNALALAFFKAVLDGTAALFGFWYTRRLGSGKWAWLVPLGVVALGPVYPRYLAAALFAALVGRWLVGSAARRITFGLGLAWGGLCLFGLDMAGYGTIILVGGWVLSPWFAAPGFRRPAVDRVALALGLGSVLVLAVLSSLVWGILDEVVWDTVVYPATRFGAAMGVSWLDSFWRDPLLRDPFAGHHTGEILAPGWPGHAWQRVLGFRALFVLVWLVPLAALAAGRKAGDVRLSPLLMLAVAGWVTLMARGDIAHLRLVWFGTLLLFPLLVTRMPGGRQVRVAVAAVVVTVGLGPLAGEQIWLAVQRDRMGLARWDRPTAGIHLEEGRLAALERLCGELPWDGTSPVLVWPAQPGLQFVLGAPLATAQATLLGGEVREAAAVIADLEASRPPVAVLGSGRGLVPGVTNLHGLQPELWSYLRHHYQRVTEHPSARESFWVATRLTDRRGQGPPHDARLPGSAQEVATGSTPVLGPGVGLGQTFRVVDFDLAGVEMMFRAPGPYPYPVAFTLTFHEIVGATGTRPLTSFPLQIQLEKRTQKVMFSFPPLAGTAGKVLLMEIAADPAASAPFRLLWNRKNAEVPRFVDYYPEGQAFLDNRPLAADLFFVTY